MPSGLIVIVIIIILWIIACLNVLREYEKAVIFRLGRVQTPDKGPGLIFILWPIDKLVRVSLRVVTWDMPPQDVITRDNVSLKVNAVVYFRVINAQRAVIELESYRYAIEQLSQTTLRSVLGEVELDDLLSQREKLNLRLQTILDEHTEPWGIKVSKVEVRQVDLPQEMQRAIARQAEAERERRAKIINADAEFQAAAKLAEAAMMMEKEPVSITLRYLQTLAEIGVEKNTTIVFPLPLDLLTGLTTPAAKMGQGALTRLSASTAPAASTGPGAPAISPAPPASSGS
ncbi:MAG: slipin family protein [Terriglobia bacterium]